MSDTFFTVEVDGAGNEWFRPTDFTRGPWDPEACHAGPPTAMLARACERALPSLRLRRLSVDLGRPVPMAGFRIEVDVVRAGRATGNTRAAIVDAQQKVCVTATGVHVAEADEALFPGTLDNSAFVVPQLADAAPGEFPLARLRHGRPGFNTAVDVRYPPGENKDPGATTVWMRTVALLPDEEPSAFQRLAPLADCGNAFSRHPEEEWLEFINTDLVLAVHREPAGEWLGSSVTSQWQPSGVGLASAVLFDDDGVVGRALQTLLLRPRPQSSRQ